MTLIKEVERYAQEQADKAKVADFKLRQHRSNYPEAKTSDILAGCGVPSF